MLYTPKSNGYDLDVDLDKGRAIKALLEKPGGFDIIDSVFGMYQQDLEFKLDHVDNVGNFAYLVASTMGLNEEKCKIAKQCGNVHDIGQIIMKPSYVWYKKELDDIERFFIRLHPDIGSELIDYEKFKDVHLAVHYHHERFDGDTTCKYPGYPFGLKGEKIPFMARLISVVDTYDTMTMDRPYKGGVSKDEAVNELIKEKGKQFDPYLVDKFLGALKTKR